MVEEFDTKFQIAFFSTLGLLLLLEWVSAWRREPVATGKRWTSNISLLVLGSLVAGLIVPVGLVGFANAQPTGPMARLGWPMSLQIVATFLVLDLYHYWEHRLYHRIPLLWRFHLVHHSDTQVDVTTTERHHPLEVVLGTALMLVIIYVCGLPAVGVGMYLLVATVVSLYSHANLHPPFPLDRFMRRLLVTAPLHAIHHSDLKAQTNSNYALVLPIWDRLFGTYSDPEQTAVAHYGLEYFHEPQDTSLGRVLLQPFLYRPQMVYPPRAISVKTEASPASAADKLDRQWNSVLQWGLPGFLLAGLALWPTLSDLARLWSEIEAYQYCWLVLPMTVYLLGWHHQQEIRLMTPQPGFAGMLLTLAGTLLWNVASLMNLDVGCHVALVLVLQGIAMALLGWRMYWRLFPILALLFFMVPAGDVLQPILRSITVASIDLFATIAGLPHQVEGFIVHIGSQRYIVVEECTGLTFVLLGAFLCYSLGLLLYRSFWKVASLAALGAMLGIVSNTVRVNSIVLADWLRGTKMPLSSHGIIQWITLLLMLALVFFVLSRLAKSPNEPLRIDSMTSPPLRQMHSAPLIAGFAVLVIVGLLHAQTGNQARLRDSHIDFTRQNIRGWELAAGPDGWVIDQANQNESLTLTYHRNDQIMHVRIVRALTPTAKLSGSSFAPDQSGVWRESAIQKHRACAGSHCVALLHSTWQGKAKASQQAFYAYGIGRTWTDSDLLMRALRGWHRISGNADAPHMIGIMFEKGTPVEPEIAQAFETIQSAIQ